MLITTSKAVTVLVSAAASVLRRWYKAMKAGDPDAVLSVGGLDYHAGVVDGYKYIEDLYTAGAGDCFDAVALHPVSSTGRGHPGQCMWKGAHSPGSWQCNTVQLRRAGTRDQLASID